MAERKDNIRIEVRIKQDLKKRLNKANIPEGMTPALVRRLLEAWLAKTEKLKGKNKELIGYIREFRTFLDNLEDRLN